ncbi:MAG: hypothetical protein DRJ32_01690 [Thermoprotei archaeon]|nr:MAG: hypothetical protein DRJ32_01690 [Thermoprotei archaeon]
MIPKVLVETGFLFALNPKDKYHKWALNVLENARNKRIILYVSPVAPIELSLIMKSEGYSDREIVEVLEAIDDIINRYALPQYPLLELGLLAYATELRVRYPELTFFDSIHASIAIRNSLLYYDLDEVLRNIIDRELSRLA